MQGYDNTRELLNVVSNQSRGAVGQEEAKAAIRALDANNSDAAKAIISSLKSGEMHPAMADLVKKAETEVQGDKPSAAPQPRRRPRM